MKMRDFFFSFRATAALLIIAASGIAAATIVESSMGTAEAARLVYHALWFELLGVAIAINIIGCLYTRHMFSTKRLPRLLVHFAIVIIVAGALVTRHTSISGYIMLRESETTEAMMSDDYQVLQLPFRLTLNKFSIAYYPHTQTPSAYASEVTIVDENEKSSYTISMNRIVKYKGWRLFQSSYSDDGTGSVLMAVYDKWGCIITYIGYWMFAIGFVLSLFRKGSPLRLFAARAAIILLLACPFAANANAEWNNCSIPKATVREFDRMVVQGSNGRIMTANSACSEIVRKLHGSNRYNGLSSTLVVMSMLSEPDCWLKEPIIKVKDKAIRQAIGAKSAYLSLDDLFSDSVKSKLDNYFRTIANNNDQITAKQSKALADLYDRADLLDRLLHGEYLAIVPSANIKQQWATAAETMVDTLSTEVDKNIARTFETYISCIDKHQWQKASQNLQAIKQMQAEAAQERYLTKSHIEAEIMYNKLDLFRYLKFAYMLTGFALLAIAVAHLLKSRKIPHRLSTVFIVLAAIMLAAHTAGMALRWKVGGFVPLSNGYETMIFIAWVCVLLGLIFAKAQTILLALAQIVAFAFLMVAGISSSTPDIGALAPVLKSPWLSIHVASITSSYAIFAIVFLLAFVNMCLMLRKRSYSTRSAIDRFTQIMRGLSVLGLFFLCLGTIFGAVWANVSWGHYWGWDPKESWALISIIAYSALVHMPQRLTVWFNITALWSFGVILMTFFGVNALFAGMHSYAGAEQSSIPAWIYAAAAIMLIFSTLVAVKSTRQNTNEVRQ